MAERLLEHLRALAGFLGQVKSAEARRNVLEAQKVVLPSMLAQAELSLADAGKVLQALNGLGLSADEVAEYEAQISERASQAAGAPVSSLVRPRLQDFEALPSYLPAALWQRLLDQQVPSGTKLDELLQHAQALQMRTPTETTLQTAAALLLLISEGEQGALAASPQVKYGTLQYLKKCWRARVRFCPVGEVVDVLPADPALFKAKHGRTFAAVFGTAGPVPAQVSETALHAVRQSIPMRCTARSLSKATSIVPAAPPPVAMPDMMASMGLMMQAFQSWAAATSKPDIPLQFFPRPGKALVLSPASTPRLAESLKAAADSPTYALKAEDDDEQQPQHEQQQERQQPQLQVASIASTAKMGWKIPKTVEDTTAEILEALRARKKRPRTKVAHDDADEDADDDKVDDAGKKTDTSGAGAGKKKKDTSGDGGKKKDTSGSGGKKKDTSGGGGKKKGTSGGKKKGTSSAAKKKDTSASGKVKVTSSAAKKKGTSGKTAGSVSVEWSRSQVQARGADGKCKGFRFDAYGSMKAAVVAAKAWIAARE